MGGGNTFGHPLDAVVHFRAGALAHGADCPLDLGGLGDHVVGGAGSDTGDGNHRGVEHVDAPGHHGLQRLHDLARNRDRVDGAEWLGCVPTATGHRDEETVCRCHDRPRAGGDDARVRRRRGVQRVSTGDWRGCAVGEGRDVEKALLQHEAGAVVPLFPRLEHEQHPPAQRVFAGSEQSGRAGQHRNVRVVAARVHGPLHTGRVVQPGVLRHREGIGIGPQQHRGPRERAGEQRGDARGGGVAGYTEIERLQRLENAIPGDRVVDALFRPAVELPSQVDGGREEVVGFLDQRVQCVIGHDRMVGLHRGQCRRTC